MKIYTKSGDKGTTAIWGGTRLSKDDSLIECYATIDELIVAMGLVLTHKEIKAEDRKFLTAIQRDLNTMMSILAGAPSTLETKRVLEMEQKIDAIEKARPVEPKFLLIQGGRLFTEFHLARVLCRRAERRLVTYVKKSSNLDENIQAQMLQYLNRLSDVFWAMSRMYNTEKEQFV